MDKFLIDGQMLSLALFLVFLFGMYWGHWLAKNPFEPTPIPWVAYYRKFKRLVSRYHRLMRRVRSRLQESRTKTA